MEVVRVTCSEFRKNQGKYFKLAEEGVKIIITRGKTKAYTLIPFQYGGDQSLSYLTRLWSKKIRLFNQSTLKDYFLSL